MKISNLIYVFIFLVPGTLGIYQTMSKGERIEDGMPIKLVWHHIQDIESLSNDKFTIVDVYTDWCKVCKVMDEKTMADHEFSSYLADNYNMIKFNAEEKATLKFKGKSYKYTANGKRGYNALAAELCQGKLAYPSFVILDQDLEVVDVMRGFKNVEKFRADLDRVMFAATQTAFSKE